MKKNLFLPLATFLLGSLFTILIIRLEFNQDKSPKYEVYKKDKDNLFASILGIIPPSSDLNLSEEVVQRNNNYKLIRIIDYRYSTPEIYYFLSNGMNYQIMKTPNINNTFDNVNIKNYYAHLIDLETFNKYYQLFHHNYNKDEMIYSYSYFLSSSIDSGSFKEIKDYNSLNNILEVYPKRNNIPLPKDKIITDYHEISNNLGKNEKVYWFYDKGLVKMKYDIIDKNLKTIETTFIGYLGNEIIHI